MLPNEIKSNKTCHSDTLLQNVSISFLDNVIPNYVDNSYLVQGVTSVAVELQIRRLNYDLISQPSHSSHQLF